MELKQFDRTVISSGTNETSFGVEINAAAINILSSDFYQYKIAAIVREYSCNAYDSHVAAGKEDQPIIMTIPNHLNPTFSVQDKGVGLDDDGVRTVFAVYFKSMKQSDNNQIGGFGLGGKCGFSYTDSFNIIAIKNGVRRQYIAFMGSEGLPAIQLISEAETDDENGVTVSFAVDVNDIDTFRGEAEVVASMFKTRPIIKGCDQFEFLRENIYESINEHGVAFVRMPYTQLYGNRSIYALLGGVAYKIPDEWLYCTDSYLRPMTSNSIIIPFEIGEIYPAVNREALQYSDETKKVIMERYEEISKRLQSTLQEKIDAAESPSEMLGIITDMVNSGMNWRVLSDHHTYEGVSLHQYCNKNIKPFYGAQFMHQKKYSRATTPPLMSYKLAIHDVYINNVLRDVMVVHNADGVLSKSNFNTLARRYIRNNIAKGRYAVLLDNLKSVEQLNRYMKYGNITPSEILSGSDLKAHFKKETKNKPTFTYARGEKNKTTVYAKHSVIGDCRIQKISHVETADQTVYYTDSETLMSYSWFWQKVGMAISGLDSVVLVLRTSQSSKTIERLNIQPVTELLAPLNGYFDDHTDYLATQDLADDVDEDYVKQFLFGRFADVLLEVSAVKNEMRHYINVVTGLIQTKTTNREVLSELQVIENTLRDLGVTLLSDDAKEKATSKINEIKNQMSAASQLTQQYEQYVHLSYDQFWQLVRMHDFCVANGFEF